MLKNMININTLDYLNILVMVISTQHKKTNSFALTDTNWFISDTMYVAGWSDGNYVIDVNVYDY